MDPPTTSLRAPLLDGEAPPLDGPGVSRANGAGAVAVGPTPTAADRALVVPPPPARHRPEPGKYDNPLLSVCPFILVNELCERLAYNG